MTKFGVWIKVYNEDWKFWGWFDTRKDAIECCCDQKSCPGVKAKFKHVNINEDNFKVY